MGTLSGLARQCLNHVEFELAAWVAVGSASAGNIGAKTPQLAFLCPTQRAAPVCQEIPDGHIRPGCLLQARRALTQPRPLHYAWVAGRIAKLGKASSQRLLRSWCAQAWQALEAKRQQHLLTCCRLGLLATEHMLVCLQASSPRHGAAPATG